MTATITIFGDIHGNLPALEAVFQDIAARRLDNLYCLGDLVGYGTFPNDVVQFVRERGIPTLMGNYDQGVGSDSDDCGCAYKTEIDRKRGELSIAWTNAHTTAENKAFLQAYSQVAPNSGRPNFMTVGAYDGMALIYDIVAKTGGNVDADKAMEVAKGWKTMSPRGPISIDPATREIVQNIYLRKVEGKENKAVGLAVKALADPARGCRM